MKLKIDTKKAQTDDKLSLFSGNRLPMPLIKLDKTQFSWPETFLVRSAKRVDEKVINSETGWSQKDDQGNPVKTGRHNVTLELYDGDLVQKLAVDGVSFEDLPVIKCLVKEDIPLEKLEDGLTLVKLVEPVVMLDFSSKGSGLIFDHVKLECKSLDFEF